MVHRNKIYDIAHKALAWPLIGFTFGYGTYLTVVFGDYLMNRRPVEVAARKAAIADKISEQQTAREEELMQQQKQAEKAF